MQFSNKEIVITGGTHFYEFDYTIKPVDRTP